MHRLTTIDLTKMSEQGRILYLQDLMIDTIDAIKDLSGDAPRYDYIQQILNHTTQAVLDLQQLVNIEGLKQS